MCRAERQAGPVGVTSTGCKAISRPVGRPGRASACLGWLPPSGRSPGALGGQIDCVAIAVGSLRLPVGSLDTFPGRSCAYRRPDVGGRRERSDRLDLYLGHLRNSNSRSAGKSRKKGFLEVAPQGLRK